MPSPSSETAHPTRPGTIWTGKAYFTPGVKLQGLPWQFQLGSSDCSCWRLVAFSKASRWEPAAVTCRSAQGRIKQLRSCPPKRGSNQPIDRPECDSAQTRRTSNKPKQPMSSVPRGHNLSRIALLATARLASLAPRCNIPPSQYRRRFGFWRNL